MSNRTDSQEGTTSRPTQCVGFYDDEGHKGCRTFVPGVESEMRLRALGWHFYTGESLVGKQIALAACPDCLRNRRPVKAVVLEDQESLF